jgi:hypothetical protein
MAELISLINHTRRPLDGEEAAERLIARLAECKTSPTILFWLRLRSELLDSTELGNALLRMCRDLNVVQSPNPHFFIFLKEKTSALAPIAPSFFVVSAKKLEAVQNFREELRRRRILDGAGDPVMYLGGFMPFCFQCLCAKEDGSQFPAKSLFFIYATPEDGMRKMLDIFRCGKYVHCSRVYTFTQVYEHRLGNGFAPISSVGISAPLVERKDNRVACILLDWEARRKQFEGRITDEEIQALCAGFPEWFYKRLHALNYLEKYSHTSGEWLDLFNTNVGHITDTLFAAVVVKQKSRPLPDDDYKYSIHVIVGVAGIPGTQLKSVCDSVFADVKPVLGLCKKAGNFSPVPDSSLHDAFYVGADLMTMGGHTGYATMYSRKKVEDPPPRLLYRAIYSDGNLVVPPPSSTAKNPKPFHPSTAPHDLATLSEADALSLLCHGLCSVPNFYTSRLSRAFEEHNKTLQSRTAARHHAVSGGGGGGGSSAQFPPSPRGDGSSTILPKWMWCMVSRERGVYTERRDSAQSYFKQLMELVSKQDAEKDWVAVHIANGALACPMCLSEDPPREFHHRNNGIIAAFMSPPESPSLVIYTRCTVCDVSPTTNPHVSRVNMSGGRPTRWVKFTEEGMEALVAMMGQGETRLL